MRAVSKWHTCSRISGLKHHLPAWIIETWLSSSSPQQQFLEALKRGDSIQASRIWLHMDADDRANLSHGAGFKPDLTPGDVQAAILKHEKEADERAGGIGQGRSLLDTPGGGHTSEAEGGASQGVSDVRTAPEGRDSRSRAELRSLRRAFKMAGV